MIMGIVYGINATTVRIHRKRLQNRKGLTDQNKLYLLKHNLGCVRVRRIIDISESKILIMYVCRCSGHVPATDSHRSAGALQT